MLQEASHKLHGIESHGAPPVAVGLSIAEGDTVVFDFDDAVIGESHFEDIGSQILDAGLALTHCLAIDVPFLLPDVGRDAIEEPGLYHLVPEFGSEDLREGLYRQVKIDSRGVPSAVAGR